MNRRTNIRNIALVSLLCLLGLATGVRAGDSTDSYRKLVRKWHGEREATVKRVVHSWLRGATAESLKRDMLEVISLDVRLANENVPLYVPSFRDPSDLDMSVADLVHKYLSGIGVVTDTAVFFQGKTFNVIKEEKSIRRNGSSSMAFLKWGK